MESRTGALASAPALRAPPVEDNDLDAKVLVHIAPMITACTTRLTVISHPLRTNEYISFINMITKVFQIRGSIYCFAQIRNSLNQPNILEI